MAPGETQITHRSGYLLPPDQPRSTSVMPQCSDQPDLAARAVADAPQRAAPTLRSEPATMLLRLLVIVRLDGRREALLDSLPGRGSVQNGCFPAHSCPRIVGV